MRNLKILIGIILLFLPGYLLCQHNPGEKTFRCEQGRGASIIITDTLALGNKFTPNFINPSINVEDTDYSTYLPSFIVDTTTLCELENLLQQGLVKKKAWKKYARYFKLIVGVHYQSDLYLIIQFLKKSEYLKKRGSIKELSLIAGTSNLKFLILKKSQGNYSIISTYPKGLFR